VRQAARKNKIPLYLIAAELGISEATFSRWLRFPLQPDKEDKIMDAIAKLEREASQ
jgi:hypothetical protein